MNSTPDKGHTAKRPAFVTLLCELGVMLFAVAAWAQSRGTLLSSSWEPVYAVALAGLLFGPVKHVFVLPDRMKAESSKSAFALHLLKTAVFALGCAVAGMAVVSFV